MIRDCGEADFGAIYAIINDAAIAYKGVIPADRWHDPYMPEGELAAEITAGVEFRGAVASDQLAGVMGLQNMDANPGWDGRPVSLIRHAYVLTRFQRRGLGGEILRNIMALSERPLLVGTWAAASWAVDFYVRHGFRQVEAGEKDRLLQTYWNIPARQVETSVVLAGPGLDGDANP
ncbi:MAG: GNAT family N-acetyltransferase [Rhodospirillaceae bacterium]|jgi:GNAT superfamily N-acetyltransferase|nr:GNAT family N-acetyltransferase [Rhodospirillaceae bacterium]MBT3884303.1 GNAT family N-acetyltransferase [Rhodospirillaceae bacterium]MBT4116404.1 GNAT family N-acetyltransferase [Rhodospirillaceae bacterium]MBT4670542.1 GNAT family N-acetyltransferase [Rhodospirillaceae bacterium]MBT4722027.1 GNAT family N-acetyltransferase [Rhodospirillaceae bacterium]